MIKLIATDMDGTLLDNKGNKNEAFDHVFKQLIEKDIKFVVASGRQYFKLKADFEKYAHDIIFIADNGSMVMYRDEEIHSIALEDKYIQSIINDVKDIKGVKIVLSGKKEAYFYTRETDMIEEIKKYYKEYEIIDSFRRIDDEILKIAVYVPENMDGVYNNILKPKWGDKVKISVSGEVWVDIYSKETDKGKAINVIQEKFGIKKEETMAFGDYFNDVEMLQQAGESYAMENAPEKFKKYAKFIAKSNEENGVLEVIREKVL